jgi:hypothetical protein
MIRAAMQKLTDAQIRVIERLGKAHHLARLSHWNCYRWPDGTKVAQHTTDTLLAHGLIERYSVNYGYVLHLTEKGKSAGRKLLKGQPGEIEQ